MLLFYGMNRYFAFCWNWLFIYGSSSISIISEENDELDTKAIYSILELFLIGETISEVNNEAGFRSGFFSFLYFY
jgi:hypothetical protein